LVECVICDQGGPAGPGSKVEPGATKPIPGIFLMKDETPSWFLCGQCLQELRKLGKEEFVVALKTIRKAQEVLARTRPLSLKDRLFLRRWNRVKPKGIMR
jgi:hypothetical protein